MGSGTSIRKQRFERLTIIVVSLVAFAFVASYLTENPEVSLLLPLVAALSNIINILNWINEPLDHDENRRLAIADAFDLVMKHEGVDAETRARIRDTVVEPDELPSTQSDITETYDISETRPAKLAQRFPVRRLRKPFQSG